MQEEPREALRLALVMNGGVSLAVWMGGVTQEIFLLTQASRHIDQPAGPGPSSVYKGLLNLTRTSAAVDVISGTSAGGVNGAALAVALLHDGDFSLLRKVWRDTGALQTLLRPALGDNPGSLLQGDEYFLPEIQAALQSLVRRPQARSAHEQPLELRLTTTLLTGHQGRHLDDLGTRLHDVDYRAQFIFQHLDDRASFTQRPHWLDALARAARSTASFPFAFEPSQVSGDIADAYLRTAHGDKVKAGDRHVIDGGILDNKPFQGALQGIFGMPRLGPTRRVLAYVNPDPGDGPEGRTGQPMPGLGKVLSEALFGIPQSQTVADHLREIRQHNDKVRRQRDSLLQVVNALSADQLASQAHMLYKVYRQRRLINTYGLFIEPRLSQAVCSLGRRTLNLLKAVFCDPDQVHDWLPTDWIDTESLAVGGDRDWQWGLFPVEFAASVMLNMLKLAESLGSLPATQLSAASAHRLSQLHGLTTLWPTVNTITAEVKQRRATEASAWDGYQQALREAWQQDNSGDDSGPMRLDALRLDMIRGLRFLSSPERQAWCKAQVRAIAVTLRALAPLAAWAAEHAIAESGADRLRRRQAEGLGQLTALFHNQATDHIIHRLLQLEVVCYAFDDHESLDQDTLIELVQVSGNLRSPLIQPVVRMEACPNDTDVPPSSPANARAPRRLAAKLRGLELAHFGAFYKSSWRANDWTHGRLDGADRLVHTLLNPERLKVLFRNRAAEVARMVRVLALGPSPDPTQAREDARTLAELCGPGTEPAATEQALLTQLWDEQNCQAHIQKELAFLDAAHLPVPDTLPHCAAAVVRRLHLHTLREELPHLIRAIAHDNHLGAEPGVNAADLESLSLTQDQVQPQDAVRALQQGLINDEGLMEQAGSDLFTRTIAHVTASVQNTVASASAKLGPISWFFALLKVPIQGFNLVAQGLTRQSRTAAVIHGGLLAVGLLLSVLSFQLNQMSTKGPAWLGSVADLGWLLLAWGALFTVIRSPRTSVLVLTVGALAGGLGIALWGPPIERQQGLALLSAAGALIGIAIFLPRLPALQWLLGLASIPVFASWSTGTPIWQRGWQLETIEWCALALVAVLLVAIWQASPMGPRVERKVRALMKRISE